MVDCDNPRWDELNPDALGLIFRNLSLQEILVVIPCVCKSWRDTVLGPYCWQEIDIINWCEQHRHRYRHRHHFQDLHPAIFNKLLQLLLTRSAGSLLKLCVSHLPNDSTLTLIAQHGKTLQTLIIQRSKIANPIVELVAKSFSGLTYLDISFCPNIGATALEAIGKHCVNLTSLLRAMFPNYDSFEDDEALAIASTMHKLKQLKITYMNIKAESLLKILENCQELEYVDVQGCWNLILDEKFNKFSRVKLGGPLVDYTSGPFCMLFNIGPDLVDTL